MRIARTIAVAAALLLAAAGARAQAPEKKDVKLGVGGAPALYYLALCELDRSRRADAFRKLAVLDGPSASWSRELLDTARD